MTATPPAPEIDYEVSPERADRLDLHDATGIYVRARHGERWVNADIAELDEPSLTRWLRSRGGENEWAEGVVRILLGHPGVVSRPRGGAVSTPETDLLTAEQWASIGEWARDPETHRFLTGPWFANLRALIEVQAVAEVLDEVERRIAARLCYCVPVPGEEHYQSCAKGAHLAIVREVREQACRPEGNR